jgi:hypothetical protein
MNMKTKTAGILSAGVLSLTALFGSALAADDQKPAHLNKGYTHADFCVYQALKEMGHDHFHGAERLAPSMQFKFLQTPYIVGGNTLEMIKNSCVKYYSDPKNQSNFLFSRDDGNVSYYKDKTSIQISHEEISFLPG